MYGLHLDINNVTNEPGVLTNRPKPLKWKSQRSQVYCEKTQYAATNTGGLKSESVAVGSPDPLVEPQLLGDGKHGTNCTES